MHPSPDDLLNFLQASLSVEQTEQVATHLEQCPQCDATLRDIEAHSDTLLQALRHGAAHPDEYAQESGCERMVERIQAIGRDPSFTSTPLSATSALNAGAPQRIGPYQILAKLGEGGMGAVYKALHTKLKKVVAIKVLPTGRTQDAHAIERFEREMEAVGRVEHPNIVRATDADESDGVHYLVMEYVDGCDLSAVVRALGPLPIADACEAVRQAAVGLQYAHEHGLVHRDIKPGNLMLNSQGQVRILDLGLARLGGALSPAGRELTSTGQVMGTLDYMAPEQCGDSREVDIRADIYSLGATLYKLLTGEAPFSGPKYETPVQKITALAVELVPDVAVSRSDVPAPLAVIVRRMLEKKPADRYATPGEVGTALAPFTAGADLVELLHRAAERQPTVEAAGRITSTLSTSEHLSSHLTDTARHRPAAAPVVPPGVNVTSPSSRRPPVPLVAIAAGMAFIMVAAGIWLVVRDKEGKERARLELKPGDGLVIESGDDGKQSVQPAAEAPKTAAPRLGDGAPDSGRLIAARGKPGGAPLVPHALVMRPAKVPGVKSWSVEPRGHYGNASAARVSPDGQRVATIGYDGHIRIWDMSSGALQSILAGSGIGNPFISQRDLSWSPSGALLAAENPHEKGFTVWQVAQARPLWKSPTPMERVHSLVWSPDNSQLIVGVEGEHAFLFDGTTGELLRTIRGVGPLYWRDDQVWSVRAVNGDKLEVSRIDLANDADPVVEWQRECTKDFVRNGLDWSNDGKHAIATNNLTGQPVVQLYRSDDGEKIREFSLPHSDVFRVLIDHDANSIAFGTNIGLLKCKNADDTRPTQTLSGGGVFGVAAGPNDRLVLGLKHGAVRCIDSKNGDVIWEIPGHSQEGFHTALPAFFPTHNQMSFQADGVVRLMDLVQLRVKQALPWLGSDTIGHVGLKDGRLASMCSTGDMYVTAVNRSAAPSKIPLGTPCSGSGHPGLVAASANGNRIAVTNGYTPRIAVCDTDGAAEPTVLPDMPSNVSGLALSPDGERLAVALDDGSLTVRSATTGEEQLRMPNRSATALAWAPDGAHLAAACKDGTVRYWELNSELPETILRGHRGSVSRIWWKGNSELVSLDQHGKIVAWNTTEATELWRSTVDALGLHERDRGAQDLNCESNLYATSSYYDNVRFWNGRTGEPLATFMLLSDDRPLFVSANGHVKASASALRDLVYVVETDDGRQVTLTAAAFAEKYGWKNDPQQVRLMESNTPAKSGDIP